MKDDDDDDDSAIHVQAIMKVSDDKHVALYRDLLLLPYRGYSGNSTI
jgi:hypothetical protein